MEEKMKEENLQQKICIRINGIGHAFSREIGCDCERCQTIKFAMTKPTGKLEEFSGWDDPPCRAHTSASILIPDIEKPDEVKNHILIDVGSGVIDSLVSSKLKGLDRVRGVLISHWHPDHVLGLNQLCESLKRSAKRKGLNFTKIPVYCTLKTYDVLRDKYPYELKTALCFHEILPGVPFKVNETPPITFIALEVAHGKAEGSVIYMANIEKRKVVFGWDIDEPNAERPSDKKKNIDIIRDNLSILECPDLLLMSANTWKATGTGHTSFLNACEYIDVIKAEKTKTFLVHLSGHEDGEGNQGYGWSDSEWASQVREQVREYEVSIARQGMLFEI